MHQRLRPAALAALLTAGAVAGVFAAAATADRTPQTTRLTVAASEFKFTPESSLPPRVSS